MSREQFTQYTVTIEVGVLTERGFHTLQDRLSDFEDVIHDAVLTELQHLLPRELHEYIGVVVK